MNLIASQETYTPSTGEDVSGTRPAQQAEPMNIGFLYGIDIDAPGPGGAVHGYQLARGFLRRGHRLFSWYFPNGNSQSCTHIRGRDFLKFLRTIDILYIRVEWNLSAARLSLIKLIRPTLPVVWEINGVPDETLFTGRTAEEVKRITKHTRRLARFADAAICGTDYVSDFAIKNFGIVNSHPVAHGSDPNLFVPGQKNMGRSKPLQVVWIGSLGAGWFDFDAIISAAEILAAQNANVIFRIYGDASKLKRAIPQNFELNGVLPYDKVGPAIADADVGISVMKAGAPNLYTASPLKVFDYMSCGLAVLAQKEGETLGLIRDHNVGLGTSGTAEDIAEKLLQLEQNRELCHELGKNGRKAVIDYYNWDRLLEETMKIFSEL